MGSGEVREGEGGEKRIKGEGRKGTEGERGGDRTNEEERREKNKLMTSLKNCGKPKQLLG